MHESELPPIWAVVWRPSLDIIREHADVAWERDVKLGPEIEYREFPDGSVEVGGSFGADRAMAVGKSIEGHLLTLGPPYRRLFEWTSCFRSLAPFPLRLYNLVVPLGYFERCGSMGPAVLPIGLNEPVSPGEHHLACLDVSVQFVRRPAKAVQSEFIGWLQEWAATVDVEGCFGEGPVRLVSETTFPGHRACFQIDASRSGQSTLNWLVVALLNFGNRVLPVVRVAFARGSEGRSMWPEPDLSKAREIWDMDDDEIGLP